MVYENYSKYQETVSKKIFYTETNLVFVYNTLS